VARSTSAAALPPADIQNMFIYDGTTVEDGSTVGVYSVCFYTPSGVAQYVTVDTELPGGGGYYDHPVGGPGAVNGSPSPVLWVALPEKAYAEANGFGYVTSNNMYCNAYDGLNLGWPEWALRAITWNAGTAHYAINPSDVASAWNAGELVVLCTDIPVSSYIVGSHDYALVNYDPSSSLPFKLFNAWGTDANGWAPGNSGAIYGLFIANAAFVSQRFSTQSFGVGAEAGGQEGQHVRISQQLVDLAFIANLMDTHSKSRSTSTADYLPASLGL
jgi:hypothetical protein